MSTTPHAESVVLVHGAYADGSSWSDVIPLLLDAGLEVIAVQNPLTTLADDAAATRRALAGGFAAPPASAGLEHADGFAQLSEDAFLNDFANGVDERRARALYAVQGPISDELFSSRTTHAAWHDKPTFYSISRNDRTTSPELERFLADRMGAHTIELESGHLAMVTHPCEVADLILLAAGRS